MASYDVELLRAARKLIARSGGQRGQLSAASIRRSISTAYYALFHFMLDETARRMVGSRANLLVRRRVLARTVTHTGMKIALDKVGGADTHVSIQAFMHPTTSSPAFARNIASVFADAQAKRHDADYNLNKPFNAADARLLASRVARAIQRWRAATAPGDRDFKHAVCVLILLKGQLRAEQ